MNADTSVVYVVDDDAAVRNSLVLLLKSVSLAATTFDSARQFLEGVPADATGCLVLDIRMPGMSGHELLQEVRRRDAEADLILITAHSSVKDAVAAIQAGARVNPLHVRL